MRNDKQVEWSRYPETAPVANNGYRPRDSTRAHLAISRDRVDSDPELDRPPPPHGGHSGDAAERVILLASPAQPGQSKFRHGVTWIVTGAVGLLGLYLLWQLVELRGNATASVTGDAFFVLAGALVAGDCGPFFVSPKSGSMCSGVRGVQ